MVNSIDNKAKEGSFEDPINVESFDELRKVEGDKWVNVDGSKEFLISHAWSSSSFINEQSEKYLTFSVKGDYFVENAYLSNGSIRANLNPVRKTFFYIPLMNSIEPKVIYNYGVYLKNLSNKK